MKPVPLPPNVFSHYYRGGSRLAALRGFAQDNAFTPEDWLAATVGRASGGDTGRSRLSDGRLFADLVAADPAGWLGSATGGPHGPTDTGILVKLLDADQRLPVHVHPDRVFAGRHLHSCYGKTEAWYVLATAGDRPSVWLGFADDVDQQDLRHATEQQDSAWMLERMHRIDVSPGDGILVPAGTAHAIGDGVFVVEVQEPTDLSILLEWSITTSTRDESHLDLGFDTAFNAVDLRGIGQDRLAGLCRHTDPAATSDTPLPALPAAADPFFHVDLLAPDTSPVSAAPGYGVLVVLDGSGSLHGADGEMPVTKGQVLAVPAAFGPWTVSGTVRIAHCRPGPAPTEPSP